MGTIECDSRKPEGTLGVRPPRNESASRAKTSGGVDAN